MEETLPPVAVDFETYYDKDDCTVRTLGPDMYTRHPKFDAYMVSVCDGEDTWVGHPTEFNWEALAGRVLLSHNSYFDETVYRSLVRAGKVPEVQFAAWHCTANMTAYLSNRRDLKGAIKFFYGVEIGKDMRDWMAGKTWADAVAAGKAGDMTEYARRDAIWCWKLFNDFGAQWPERERRLSALTIAGGRHGVAIDTELLHKYWLDTQQELINIQASLPWTERGMKPGSPKALAEQCRIVGIPCPPTKTDDEDGYLEWEDTYKSKYAWVANVSFQRSVNKVLTTLETIRARLRPDGTIESPLKYAGAHTLRWSGTDGINFQNFRRVPLVCNGTPIDIRRLIIPRPGKKFIIADLSQIEPRVLAWLCGNTELLDLLRGGMDIYEAFARVSMGWTGGNLKKEDPDQRQMCKVQVLQLGYGSGWEKFMSIAANDYGVNLTPEQAQAVVEHFRKSNPKITNLWKTLDTAFKRSVTDKEFRMELPSGRELVYRNVARAVRVKTDPETGEIIKNVAVSAEVTKGGRAVRGFLYGGLLTENITQAVARDAFAESVLALADQGHIIPFTVHDEVIIEADLSASADDVVRTMSRTPAWLEGCPIAAEGHEADYYKK